MYSRLRSETALTTFQARQGLNTNLTTRLALIKARPFLAVDLILLEAPRRIFLTFHPFSSRCLLAHVNSVKFLGVEPTTGCRSLLRCFNSSHCQAGVPYELTLAESYANRSCTLQKFCAFLSKVFMISYVCIELPISDFFSPGLFPLSYTILLLIRKLQCVSLLRISCRGPCYLCQALLRLPKQPALPLNAPQPRTQLAMQIIVFELYGYSHSFSAVLTLTS
jgi:hypothetical protein